MGGVVALYIGILRTVENHIWLPAITQLYDVSIICYKLLKQEVPHIADNLLNHFWNHRTVYLTLHCVQKKTPTHIFFHISMSDV